MNNNLIYFHWDFYILDPEFRPVLVLGPLAEFVVDKLVTDFPEKFKKVIAESRHCTQAALEQEMTDNLIVDYRRKGNYFECTTVSSVRSVCNSVCFLDTTGIDLNM